MRGNQGRNLEVVAEAETMEHCLLTYCPCLAQPRPSCTEAAQPTVGWEVPHQSRKLPSDLCKGQSDGGIFLIEVPLPR